VALGGSELRESAGAVRQQAERLTAQQLEAAADDIVFDEGEFSVVGAPSRSITIKEIAERAYSGDLPDELQGLEHTSFFSPSGSTAPFGTHLAIVEVDPSTGNIDLERYIAIDDVGTQVNPTILEGQIVGGVVQSIGQAFYEDARYDSNGTLVSGSLMDYALPKAMNTPDIEWDSTVTPSPHNPLGVKGAGEAGTIGSMPALVNAVMDAVAPLGVDSIDMPLTNERVWQAIQAAER
jgi:carbon-monoxide dehydrogenase large subunit